MRAAAVVAVAVAACGAPSDEMAGPDAAADAAPDAGFERLADMIANIEVSTYGNNYIYLDAALDGPLLPDDTEMTASFRGATYEIGRETSTNRFRIGAWMLAAPVIVDEIFTVTIVANGQVATATVTTPAPFMVGSASGFCGTVSNPIVVTWSPTSTDSMRWDASSGSPMGNTCSLMIPADRSLPDTGMVEIPYCLIGSGPQCTTSRHLVRFRTGTQDGLAAGGAIRASQKRPF